jgi:hypothetical protein
MGERKAKSNKGNHALGQRFAVEMKTSNELQQSKAKQNHCLLFNFVIQHCFKNGICFSEIL